MARLQVTKSVALILPAIIFCHPHDIARFQVSVHNALFSKVFHPSNYNRTK